MRKLILSLILLAAVPIARAADNGIVLRFTDGSKVGFSFKDKPAIGYKTVDNVPTLTITSGGFNVQYDYSNVELFYWSADVSTVPTAISDVPSNAAGNVSFHISDNGISVSGLAKGESVDVYTVNGAKVASAVSQSGGGDVNVTLPQGSGVYIVKAPSGISYKFIRK